LTDLIDNSLLPAGHGPTFLFGGLSFRVFRRTPSFFYLTCPFFQLPKGRLVCSSRTCSVNVGWGGKNIREFVPRQNRPTRPGISKRLWPRKCSFPRFFSAFFQAPLPFGEPWPRLFRLGELGPVALLLGFFRASPPTLESSLQHKRAPDHRLKQTRLCVGHEMPPGTPCGFCFFFLAA